MAVLGWGLFLMSPVFNCGTCQYWAALSRQMTPDQANRHHALNPQPRAGAGARGRVLLTCEAAVSCVKQARLLLLVSKSRPAKHSIQRMSAHGAGAGVVQERPLPGPP